MDLVIVESPTKAKTLTKILGKKYKIEASMGHIRDLPKSGLGVDIEKDFTPEYVVPEKATKTINLLKKEAKTADNIILATDPDREGEAIAWHLKHLLTHKKDKHEFSRVVFHELTQTAVEEAFAHPSTLNTALVDAQQARRILDRLVGYKLSPLLWKKVRYGLSAGRVQSVAVRLIVERERERNAFKADEYWSITADFKNNKKAQFTSDLDKFEGKPLEIQSDKQALKIENDLKSDEFAILEIKKSSRERNPSAPYRTSTLQQAAANIFGYPAQKTMSAAQKLFEKGHITYHRTDSSNLSPQFIDQARKFIKKSYGDKYLPAQAIAYETKSKNAQEAHEAIRPTDLTFVPTMLKTQEEENVYALIYSQALSSQMTSSQYEQTIIIVASKKGYQLKTSGSIMQFDGWLKVKRDLGLENESSDKELPADLNEGDVLDLLSTQKDQHFTQPPARYSDASLIKKLEELGIGRPSTYAPTISNIKNRGYIIKEGRYYFPADVAYVVIDLLVEHFPGIVDYTFTAEMEEKLDDIAEGKAEWVPMIRDFYLPFEKEVEEGESKLSKRDVTNLGPVGEKCPDCGSDLIFKLGKFGKFISCSNYPACNYARPIDQTAEEEKEDFGKCDQCADGIFVLKAGRFGKFLACSNYPKCKTTKPYLEKIGMKCPKCSEGDVIIKKAKGRVFYGCSKYPDCDYSSWKNPLPVVVDE